MSDFDLRALLDALRDVKFVVVGGVAVAAHGHLRAMKAATGRAQDRADLENLPDPAS